MRRFLLYLVFVILSSGIISWLFFKKINVSRIKEKDLSALDYSMKSHEYNDLIFIGGSRVRNHINPAVIDSVTGTRSYSVSIDGMGIVECNLILNEYLKNHPKPKTVFLNVDMNMFYTSGPIYNLTDYFSYLSDSLAFRCLSPYRLVYRSRLVQLYYKMQQVFATTDWSKMELILNPHKKEINFHATTAESTRGFVFGSVTWGPGSEELLKYRVKVVYQEEGIDLLKKMIERCRKDSINIVLFYSPSYIGAEKIATNSKEIRAIINDVASHYNVPLWDYENMQICNSKKFFMDPLHLNQDGAYVFSRQLANDINEKFYERDSTNTNNLKLNQQAARLP